MSGESRSIAFKKLTKQSIRDIHERILNEKLKEEINKAEKQISEKNLNGNSSPRNVSKNKNEKKDSLEPNKDYMVGNSLPNRYHHLFPENLYGVPIEEIDPYWKKKYVIF